MPNRFTMDLDFHMEGWIKLYRKSVDSEVFQNEGLWKIWTWCLLKANHENGWVKINPVDAEKIAKALEISAKEILE